MERKGGCCLAPRYGAAAAAQQQQQASAAWQMGRIMLKFRPIAPKPAAMAPVPAPTLVTGPAVGAGRGGKRKAVCGGGGRRGRKPKKAAAPAAVVTVVAAPALDAGDCKKDCDKEKSSSSRSSSSSSSSGMTSVDSSPPLEQQQHHHQLATLTLMPVATPVEDKDAAVGAATEELPAPLPLPSQVATPAAAARPFALRAMHPVPAAAATPLVTVEEVTATWRDGEALPSSVACAGSYADDEAPAFVSDQWGRVTWRNAAFDRDVSADDGDVAEALVALGGTIPAWGTCAGFTCRVRVRVRHSSPRHVVSSVVAPCDVWRLDAGGSYLWRLDLQAALTLGGRL